MITANKINRTKTQVRIAALMPAIAFILAFIAIADASGQDPANPQRGIVQGGSYAISDIENINTTNGNLILNIPLVSLPKGRGGAGASISLQYNSKLYDTKQEEFLNQSQQIRLQNALAVSNEGGWKYVRNDYSLLLVKRFDTYSPPDCTVGEYAYQYRLYILMPDGSRKEFRPTNRDDIYSDGFYNVTPDGKQHGNCQVGSSTWSTSGMVYYSTDGSYTKLVVGYVSNATSLGANNPWSMYMADGSKITGGTGVFTRVYDRNGNYVEGLTDAFGRDLGITLNAGTNEDHVTMLGVGGEEIVWKVFWKTIEVDHEYATTAVVNGIGRTGGTSTQTFSGDFRVVDRIELPAQFGDLEYSFVYNTENSGTGWGEVQTITMPSGAEVEFSFTTPIATNTDRILQRYPSSKELTYLAEYDGSSSSVTDTWSYEIGKTTSTITNPDGSWTIEYHGDTSYEHLSRGLVGKTVSSNGGTTHKLWTHQSPAVANNTVYINPSVDLEFTTVADANGDPALTKIVDYNRDLNGNVTETKEYDWVAWSSVPKTNGNPTGIPGGATLKRRAVNEYYNSPTGNNDNGYWDADSMPVRNVIKSTEVQNGSSTPVARTEFFYDDENDTANLTSTKVWDSFKGGSAQSYSNPLTTTNSHTTSATYNSYGMPLTSTDANTNVTSITYGNVSCPGGTVTNLYPTQTVAAYGTSIARTSTAVYDCYTGLTTSTIDEDNDVTNAMEYDDLGRPVKAITAQGATGFESWTQTIYNDEDRYVIVKSDLETKGDYKKVATQHFDQLGRVHLSRTLENSATEDPENVQHGIKVQTRYSTTYSSPNGYTYQITSNPYRASTSSGASGESTMGWTRSKSWHTGIKQEVESFTGSSLPAPWGSNTTSTGKVVTDIDANATTVTDQASKVRRSITNGLGQLIRVDEPNGSNVLGTVGSPNQPTEYTYDTLNSLLTVTQAGSGETQCGPGNTGSCSQTRTFTYSTLSRLKSATNPESGTINYKYDSNGNLIEKTDARSIVTTYTYDALNRVTDRDYSDTTPDVDYFYGTAAPKIGKLVKVTNGTGADRSTTEYTAFDILGRVTAHKQTTDSIDYMTAYAYNLSGAMIEQTYPSGRKVQNVLDSNGDVEMVKSRKNASSGYWAYANNFTYNAAGAVTAMQLGNGTWESTAFNSRLQPTQIALGATQGATGLLKLDYTYGTTANNGNVLSQKITVSGTGGFSAIQNYTYDSLNRIDLADEKPEGWTDCTSDPTKCWTQDFTYDRYGNRNFNEAATTTLPKNCGTSPNFTVCTADKKIVNPAIDTTNNRLDTDDDYTFDSAGNTTEDAQGRTFVYDAENKQVEVIDNSVTVGEYFYDGDGRRVKKVVPATGETTIFVYDAAGKLIAEYSTIVTSTENAKVAYLTNDHLGSPRINTDKNGSVTSRHDYHPFGEDIATTQRTSGLRYTDDTVRKQFTGYERDTETDLDFAQARYMSSGFGRFSSPDPLQASARASKPQTWNRYTYALNNPLRYVDIDGMDVNILDEKARRFLLKALPEEIRAKINSAIEKGNGNLKPGSLDKIKSKDENFAALKTLVDAKEITEAATGKSAKYYDSEQTFSLTTWEKINEADVQAKMQSEGISREEAEKANPNQKLTGKTGFLGVTLGPNGEDGSDRSPSGNLRALGTDGTGEGISEEDAVVTMGHELFGHAYFFRTGNKNWTGHGPVMKAIDERTRKNYLDGEQRKNAPVNLKPKQ